jgi:hypothetical protein
MSPLLEELVRHPEPQSTSVREAVRRDYVTSGRRMEELLPYAYDAHSDGVLRASFWPQKPVVPSPLHGILPPDGERFW